MRYQIIKQTLTAAFLSPIFLNLTQGMEVPQDCTLKANISTIELEQSEINKKYHLEETVLDLIQIIKISINISDDTSAHRAKSHGYKICCSPHIFKIIPRNKEELHRWCAQGFQYNGVDGLYAKRERSCKSVIRSLLEGMFGLDYFYQKRTDSSQRKLVQKILEKALQELDKITPKTENLAVDALEVFLEDLSKKLSEIPDGKILALFGTTEASYKCEDILKELLTEFSSLSNQNKKDALQDILQKARLDLVQLPDDTPPNELGLFMAEVSNSLSQVMDDEPLGHQRDPLEIYKTSSKLVKDYKDEIKFCTLNGVLLNPQGYQYKTTISGAQILMLSEKRMIQCKSIIADLKIKFESLFGGDQLNAGQKVLDKYSQKFSDIYGKSSDSRWYILTKELMEELSAELSKALDKRPLNSNINPLKIYVDQIPHFVEKKQFTDHYSFRLFCCGIQQGCLPLVQYVIHYHNNIWDRMNLADELTFFQDGHLYTLMTYLIMKDYVDIFDSLIQCKEFKDYAFGSVLKDLTGNTPLHTLAKQGSKEMIQRFLKEQDIVNVCLKSKNLWGENGMNPVQIALKEKQPQGIINILAAASRRGI